MKLHILKNCLFLLFVFIHVRTAVAGTPAELFDQANRAYAEGKFDEAVSKYEETATRYGISVSLFYNLGNAYFHTGNVGRAVLNYERALILDPRNADVLANLALVRNDFGLFVEPPSFAERCFHLLSLNQWAWLEGLSFSLIAVFFLVRGVLPSLVRNPVSNTARGWFKLAISILAAVVLLSVAAMFIVSRDLKRSVVVGKNTRLIISPFESAESAGSLKEGLVVLIQKTYGDFLLIEEESGRSGWVEKKAIEPLL